MLKSRVNRYHLASIFAITAVISGCGGGGDSTTTPANATPAATSAEGVYGGTLTGGSSPAFQLLVLPDGQYWSMYGTRTSTAFLVAGFVQGTGTSNSGIFTSSSAKDFGTFPAESGTVTANYDVTAKTIAGTVSSAGGTASFSGGPIGDSTYIYLSAASQAAISGSWTGANTGGETVSLAIGSDGQTTATTSGGCVATGSVVPRPGDRNVFTVTLLQGGGCSAAGQTVRGIALVYPLASGKTQFVGAVVDDARTAGTAVFATR